MGVKNYERRNKGFFWSREEDQNVEVTKRLCVHWEAVEKYTRLYMDTLGIEQAFSMRARKKDVSYWG